MSEIGIYIIDHIPTIIGCTLAYFIGSVPFGLILPKIFGYGDIRQIGSGNIGTTNVLRTGSKKLAALTLLLDAVKGAIATQILYQLYLSLETDGSVIQYDYQSGVILGMFAVLGHCFPIWLKFKGGKGVATALGVLLAAAPYAGLAACATWIITAKVSKISSLSALIAVAVAPFVTFFYYGENAAEICTLITVLVWVRHKDNIKRLLKGEEPKIGQGKEKKPEHTQKGDNS